MSFLEHPKVARVRDDVLANLREVEYHFRKVKNVVFLCGAAGSASRDRFAQYLRHEHSDNLLVFYADDVWNLIASQYDLDALQMEKRLAELSDLVTIIVESPGTFAELGAFSISEHLRPKLLLILDRAYRHASSFINTGPVRWTDKDSKFGPALYVDLQTILSAADQFAARLERLPKPTSARIPDLAASPKHLLFFLCDLIAIFGPCTIQDLEALTGRLLNGPPEMSIAYLTGLSVAMGLVRTVVDPSDIKYYYRPPVDDRLQSFHRKKYFNLSVERAKMVGALLAIEEARAILRSMGSSAP